MSVRPESPEAVVAAVREHPRIHPRAGGSKPALSTAPAGATPLDLSALRGILTYDPAEFTLTALAGTPVAEIEEALAAHGQYLPFDPLLTDRGATLGGTVAAGTSGPGRYRFGGVRDFLLEVRFVDGRGTLVRGGGRVVKNAAGFDLPKMMVGSRGTLGILVDLTVKVFPRPEAHATLQITHPTLDRALESLATLATLPTEFHAVELAADGTLWLRLGGPRATLEPRLSALASVLGGGEPLSDAAEGEHWHGARELSWLPGETALVKVALTPARIPELERALAGADCPRRYGAGGQVAWLGWPGPLEDLDRTLARLALPALLLRGHYPRVRLGRPPEKLFAERVQRALDPDQRFMGA